MKFSFILKRLVGPLLLSSLLLASLFTALTPQKAEAAPKFTISSTTQIQGTDIFGSGNGANVTFTKRDDGAWLGTWSSSADANAYSVTLSKFVKVDDKTYTATLTYMGTGENDSGTSTVTITDPSNVFNGQLPGSSTTGPGGGGTATTDEDTGDGCPIEEGTDFRWAMCPVTSALTQFTNFLDGVINDYLTSGNKIYASQGADSAVEASYKTAWGVFRNFAIALLMIAGLAMLISEAIGLSFVDAYTVRKALPRLLLAIFAIAVSWEFCKFMVILFDDLGQGVGSIIYSSFKVDDAGVSVTTAILSQLIVGGAGITAAGLLLGGFGILSILGTLALAMLVAMIALVLRQAIIIVCVIVAALAMAARVLPNTEKLSSFWWDAFWRMLALYPIATGLIAFTKSLGMITMNTASANPDSNDVFGIVVATITGTVLFFAGYVMIPFAFRMAGGIVATLGGIVNDRSRGGFDRLKNYRSGKMESNSAAMARGDRFKGNNALSSRFNNFSGAASTLKHSRYKGSFLTNKTARNTAIAEHEAALGAEHAKSGAGEAAKFNDDILQAQAMGRTESEARENYKKVFTNKTPEQMEAAMAAARANGGFSAARQQYAVAQAAATGTGYDNLNQMAQAIAVASHDNEGIKESIVGNIRASGAGGRYDLAGMGHSTLSKLAQDSIDHGNGAPNAELVDSALIEAGRSTNASRLMTGKPKAVSEITSANARRMKARQALADSDAAPEIRDQARAEVAEITTTFQNLQGAAPFASEANLSTLAINQQTVAVPKLSKETPIEHIVGDEARVKEVRDRKVVPGNIGRENSDVETIVSRTRTAHLDEIKNPDGSVTPNPYYQPDGLEQRTINRTSQERGGKDPYGALDPRRDDEGR